MKLLIVSFGLVVDHLDLLDDPVLDETRFFIPDRHQESFLLVRFFVPIKNFFLERTDVGLHILHTVGILETDFKKFFGQLYGIFLVFLVAPLELLAKLEDVPF